MKCFYHKSDLDGHCSGAIVKRAYPNCECIGVDYNDTLESLGATFEAAGDKVFVVDFRFNEADMDWLNANTELYWIDHHKTSIDRAHETGFLASGGQSLEIGMAGCELTWKYLNESDLPGTVLLLGRYDVWDHADDRVLPFQYGMREYENTLPESEIWESLFNDDGRKVISIIESGKVILAYQDKQNAMYAKGMAYEGSIDGLRAIIMNKAYANSKAFDAVYDPKKHDVMVLFGIKEDEYKYTLFSDKDNIDVSAIAKKYGGGGHKWAAGFYSKSRIV